MSISTHLCAICQKAISPTTTLGFCEEHLQQFQMRRREGVDTEALDSRWGDTLDIWKGRPIELEGELDKRPSTSIFLFSIKEKDWIVFIRSYYLTQAESLRARKSNILLRKTPRLNDTLAINVVSGEIRRFVSLPTEIVLEDLRGERLAPYQTELAPFWGNPDLGDMQERWMHQFYDTPNRINIPKVVAQAEYPVYGFIDHTANFALESLLTSSFSNYRVNSIGFLFASLASGQGQPRKLYLSSGTSKNPVGEGLKFLDTVSGYDHYEQLLLFYHLKNDHQESANSPSLWDGEVLVGQKAFLGEFRYWHHPYKLSLFSLKDKGSDLSLEGSACGLSFEELFGVLHMLQIINQRKDVLIQYQNERQE